MLGLEIATLAAVAGGIAMFWSKLQVVGQYLLSFAFVQVNVDQTIAHGILRYSWANLDRSPFGVRSFIAFNLHVQSEGRARFIPFEIANRNTLVFWRGWRPLVVSQGSSNGGDNQSQQPEPGAGYSLFYRILFVRGLCPLRPEEAAALGIRAWTQEGTDVVVREGVEQWNQHLEASEDQAERTLRRFRVEKKIGRGSVHARGGGDQHGTSVTASEVDSGGTNHFVRGGQMRVLGYNLDDVGVDIPRSQDPFELWPFPPHVMDLVRQFEIWSQSREWFQARGVPHRTGLNVYGPPGSGKTTLLKAIAQRLDLPVQLFDLGSMSDDEFSQFWYEALSNTPVMIVFEEFDGVFDSGRNNIRGEQGGGLGFDCVLEHVSGMGNADGVFLGITTNHIDQIDPAFGGPDEAGRSRRPGRVEHVLRLGEQPEAQRRQVARNILRDTSLDTEAIVAEGEGMVADVFVRHCLTYAYEDFWGRMAQDQALVDYQEAEYQTTGQVPTV